MDNLIYVIIVLSITGALYLVIQMVKIIRRVGFLHFLKALAALIAAFVAAGLKFTGGVFGGGSKGPEATGKTPDPFLSPTEKSPIAQSPLIENPIDNPEGYYVDD